MTNKKINKEYDSCSTLKQGSHYDFNLTSKDSY